MAESDDARRFTEIYGRTHRYVLAYALRRVGPANADDVVAEVFTAAWRHLDRLGDDPLPWLYRAAFHAVANQRRTRVRQDRLTGRLHALPSSRGAHPDHADLVAEHDRVTVALRRLPSRDREALLLTCWEDLDLGTAAEVLGCTAAALKVRLHRARRRLGRLLAGEDATREPSWLPPHAPPSPEVQP